MLEDMTSVGGSWGQLRMVPGLTDGWSDRSNKHATACDEFKVIVQFTRSMACCGQATVIPLFTYLHRLLLGVRHSSVHDVMQCQPMVLGEGLTAQSHALYKLGSGDRLWCWSSTSEGVKRYRSGKP